MTERRLGDWMRLAAAAILFDVGDTILVERRFELEAGIRAAIPQLATRVPTLAASFRAELRAQHRENREPLLARWLTGHVEELSSRSIDMVERAIWPAVVTLEPKPGVEKVLAKLRAAGVILGAVSNAYFSGKILQEELNRWGLGDSFAFVLSSGDLGWRKPGASIFERALQLTGTTPGETWFIGDSYEEDIVGARRAGLTPVWMRADAAEPEHEDVERVGDWPAVEALWAAGSR